MGFKKGPGWEERDDRERDRERRDMAFKWAKAMKDKQRKELEKRGLSPEAIKDKLENENVGQLADFLYKMKPEELDKQIAKEKEALGQAARKSKKSLSNLGRRTASEINHIGSKFKGYLQGKRDLRNRERERNDTRSERENPPIKERAPRKDSSSKRKSPAGREGKERQNKSDLQTPISVKDLFKGVRQLQREKSEVPKQTEPHKAKIRGKEREKYHEIDHYHPTVRGEKVTSYKQLKEIADKEFPGCKRIKDFDKFMDGAKKHFELIDKLKGKTHLEYGEVARISKELNQDFSTIKEWAKKTKSPKLYTTLESAISNSEGIARVEKMIQENSGIRNMDDVQRRLSHYYAEKEYRTSPNYKKDLEMAKKYFKFHDLLKEGGSTTEIGRQIDTRWSVIGRWLNGQAPWMVQLSSTIPDDTPKEGHVWLPTITGPKNNPGGFIEAPVKVDNWKDVDYVLKQLKSIDNPEVEEYHRRFGSTTKEDSIMYVLGSLLSDGNSRLTTETNTGSSRFSISLGKKYSWSIDYGDGTCYHLSKIGISATRGSDLEPNQHPTSYPNHGAYQWQGEASVLTTWLRRSCLGLRDSESKTFDSIDAPWILSAPESWRKPFLQGICDGDGCASVKAQYLSMATSSNTENFRDLLTSFGINSHKGDGAVAINERASIERAAEVKMFRYATGRKENLDKLVKMFETIDYSKPITPTEMEHIKQERELGKSYGDISESLYDRFGRTRPHHSIQYHYEKSIGKKKKRRSAQPN